MRLKERIHINPDANDEHKNPNENPSMIVLKGHIFLVFCTKQHA